MKFEYGFSRGLNRYGIRQALEDKHGPEYAENAEKAYTSCQNRHGPSKPIHPYYSDKFLERQEVMKQKRIEAENMMKQDPVANRHSGIQMKPGTKVEVHDAHVDKHITPHAPKDLNNTTQNNVLNPSSTTNTPKTKMHAPGEVPPSSRSKIEHAGLHYSVEATKSTCDNLPHSYIVKSKYNKPGTPMSLHTFKDQSRAHTNTSNYKSTKPKDIQKEKDHVRSIRFAEKQRRDLCKSKAAQPKRLHTQQRAKPLDLSINLGPTLFGFGGSLSPTSSSSTSGVSETKSSSVSAASSPRNLLSSPRINLAASYRMNGTPGYDASSHAGKLWLDACNHHPSVLGRKTQPPVGFCPEHRITDSYHATLKQIAVEYGDRKSNWKSAVYWNEVSKTPTKGESQNASTSTGTGTGTVADIDYGKKSPVSTRNADNDDNDDNDDSEGDNGDDSTQNMLKEIESTTEDKVHERYHEVHTKLQQQQQHHQPHSNGSQKKKRQLYKSPTQLPTEKPAEDALLIERHFKHDPHLQMHPHYKAHDNIHFAPHYLTTSSAAHDENVLKQSQFLKKARKVLNQNPTSLKTTAMMQSTSTLTSPLATSTSAAACDTLTQEKEVQSHAQSLNDSVDVEIDVTAICDVEGDSDNDLISNGNDNDNVSNVSVSSAVERENQRLKEEFEVQAKKMRELEAQLEQLQKVVAVQALSPATTTVTVNESDVMIDQEALLKEEGKGAEILVVDVKVKETVVATVQETGSGSGGESSSFLKKQFEEIARGNATDAENVVVATTGKVSGTSVSPGCDSGASFLEQQFEKFSTEKSLETPKKAEPEPEPEPSVVVADVSQPKPQPQPQPRVKANHNKKGGKKKGRR